MVFALPERFCDSLRREETMTSSTILCPRCDEELEVVHVSTIEVDGCPRCGGLWLDPDATAHVVESMHEGALRAAEETAREATHDADTEARGVPCPECDWPMERFTIGGSEVELDRCLNHGTWFDREELLKVARDVDAMRRKSRGLGPAVLGVAGTSTLGVAAAATAVRVEDQRARSSAADAIDAGLEVADVADLAVSTVGEVAVDAVLTGGEVVGTVLEVMAEVLGGIFGGL